MMEDDLAIMGGAQVGFQGVETGFGGGLERMQAICDEVGFEVES